MGGLGLALEGGEEEVVVVVARRWGRCRWRRARRLYSDGEPAVAAGGGVFIAAEGVTCCRRSPARGVWWGSEDDGWGRSLVGSTWQWVEWCKREGTWETNGAFSKVRFAFSFFLVLVFVFFFKIQTVRFAKFVVAVCKLACAMTYSTCQG